jgi:hypothetical protein
MSYLPYLAPSEKTKLSPRARELATQIEKVIQEFQRSYPDTPSGDVQQALTALTGDSNRPPASRNVLVMTLAGGIAALVGVLFFLRESGGGAPALPADSMLWIVASVIGLIAVAAVVRRR